MHWAFPGRQRCFLARLHTGATENCTRSERLGPPPRGWHAARVPSPGGRTIVRVSTAKVINLDRPDVHRTVPRLGERRFRGASVRLESRLAAHYDRPLQVNYRAFVNELVAGTMLPALTASQVDALPERSRAIVRSGVVEACDLTSTLHALRGSSPLGPDERVFAAMLWHYDGWTARMGEFGARLGLAASKDVAKSASAFKPQFAQLQGRFSNILGAAGLPAQPS